MLLRLVWTLTICCSPVLSALVEGIFTNLTSITESDRSIVSLKRVTFDWAMTPGQIEAGDSFVLMLPCVRGFPAFALEANLKVYAECSFIVGDFANSSVAECNATDIVTKKTNVYGTVAVPMAFAMGKDSTELYMDQARCFHTGDNDLTFSDGPNVFRSMISFDGADGEENGLYQTIFGSKLLYFLAGDCPSGYELGVIGLQSSGGIDCASVKHYISNNFNDWFFPRSSEIDYDTRVICNLTTVEISYTDIPSGYRPFISFEGLVFFDDLGLDVLYTDFATCYDSAESYDNTHYSHWGSGEFQGPEAFGKEIEIITRTWDQPGTQTTAYPPGASTWTFWVNVPTPTVTTTQTSGSVLSTLTIPATSPGDTDTLIIFEPTYEPPTTTTTTTTGTDSFTATYTVTNSEPSGTETVIVVVPSPIDHAATTTTTTGTDSLATTYTVTNSEPSGTDTIVVVVPSPIGHATTSTTTTGTDSLTTTYTVTNSEPSGTDTVVVVVPSPIGHATTSTTTTGTDSLTTTYTVTNPEPSGTDTVVVVVPSPIGHATTTTTTTGTDSLTTTYTVTNSESSGTETVIVVVPSPIDHAATTTTTTGTDSLATTYTVTNSEPSGTDTIVVVVPSLIDHATTTTTTTGTDSLTTTYTVTNSEPSGTDTVVVVVPSPIGHATTTTTTTGTDLLTTTYTVTNSEPSGTDIVVVVVPSPIGHATITTTTTWTDSVATTYTVTNPKPSGTNTVVVFVPQKVSFTTSVTIFSDVRSRASLFTSTSSSSCDVALCDVTMKSLSWHVEKVHVSSTAIEKVHISSCDPTHQCKSCVPGEINGKLKTAPRSRYDESLKSSRHYSPSSQSALTTLPISLGEKPSINQPLIVPPLEDMGFAHKISPTLILGSMVLIILL